MKLLRWKIKLKNEKFCVEQIIFNKFYSNEYLNDVFTNWSNMLEDKCKIGFVLNENAVWMWKKWWDSHAKFKCKHQQQKSTKKKVNQTKTIKLKQNKNRNSSQILFKED